MFVAKKKRSMVCGFLLKSRELDYAYYETVTRPSDSMCGMGQPT